MIELKLFELRDRGTFIPAFAFRNKPMPDNEGTFAERKQEQEDWLFRRAGFGVGSQHLVTLGNLHYVKEAHWDPIEWDNQRTWGNAHRYIEEHWDELQSGQVIDVEFILGEKPAPKVSERTEEVELLRRLDAEL